MTRRRPKALSPGATIRLISPASPFAPDRLDRCAAWLREVGYNVEVGKNAFATGSYLAGADEGRIEDINDAFFDSAVDAVYCTRGGYGCARIMPSLDPAALAATGKFFLGFSDITTLHLALNAHGLATVYAPMALTFHRPRDAWVYESFLNVLSGKDPIPANIPRATTVVGGKAKGVMTGGCLCLLTDSLATSFALEARGKIVLIEDVDEPPHRVDAMLTHLLNAGAIQDAAGFVVGEMTRSDEHVDDSIGGADWREIVADRLRPLGRPLVLDFPFGHANNMLSLPLGIRAELDADAGTLTYLEPLCR